MWEQAGWEPGKARSPHGRAGWPLEGLIHPCCTRVPDTREPWAPGDPAGAQPRLAGAHRTRTWLLLGEASWPEQDAGGGLAVSRASQHRGKGLPPGYAFKPMLPPEARRTSEGAPARPQLLWAGAGGAPRRGTSGFVFHVPLGQ